MPVQHPKDPRQWVLTPEEQSVADKMPLLESLQYSLALGRAFKLAQKAQQEPQPTPQTPPQS